jgi:hypothetical protein
LRLVAGARPCAARAHHELEVLHQHLPAGTIRLRNIARIEGNLETAEAFFARWPQRFDWRRPLAGSTALVGFDVPSVSELSQRLAAEQGVLIQSAAMLGGSDQQMRIGLGRDGFAAALARFETWLRRES